MYKVTIVLVPYIYTPTTPRQSQGPYSLQGQAIPVLLTIDFRAPTEQETRNVDPDAE